MQDRIPLYPGRVTLTAVAGQANTYDMERADSPTQEGTPLNKASLLKDSTATLFGLTDTAVPDDVLGWIGKYNEHWWKRRSATNKTYYKLASRTAAETTGLSSSGTVSFEFNSGKASWASELDLNANTGELKLKNPTVMYSASDLPGTIPNAVYIQSDTIGVVHADSDNSAYITEPVMFTGSQTSSGSGFKRYSASNTVVYYSTPYEVTEYGDWELVHSLNYDDYGGDGIHDGYEYVYLGRPFENLKRVPRIDIGTYIGTGVSGSPNKNILSFPFVPALVIVAPTESTSYSIDSQDGFVIFVNGQVSTYGSLVSRGSTGSNYVSINIVSTWSNSSRMLSWYTSSSAPTFQLNRQNHTYRYVAIG